jgi:chondroitin 4-sulfotransferase 11
VRYARQTVLLGPYSAVYIATPKVACTSIKMALAKLLGLGLESTDPHRVRWPSAKMSSNRTGPLFPDLFTFAFVRNPWDRLVSCYRDKIGGEVDGYTYCTIRPGIANCLARFDVFFPGMSFSDFVAAVALIPDDEADPHFRSQHTFVTNEANAVGIDFLGRFERLADDFRLIQEKIGLPCYELPWLQRARKLARYADFYTEETWSMAGERFRKDIEMFGYEFHMA